MGSAESEKYDQVLDSVLVGPVPAGKHMFTLEVSQKTRSLNLAPAVFRVSLILRKMEILLLGVRT